MAITNGLNLCKYCNSEFTKKSYQQIYCSVKCQYTHTNKKANLWRVNPNFCMRCDSSLVGKRGNAIYCSQTCKSMDHNFKHRSHVKVMSTARRQQILARDNSICYLCTEPITGSFDLDHLVPVSRGGSSEPSNLAATHPFCNKKRGSRIGKEQLLKLTELSGL